MGPALRGGGSGVWGLAPCNLEGCTRAMFGKVLILFEICKFIRGLLGFGGVKWEALRASASN